jgi:putative N6-adenine-specific DNA methylase
MVFLSDWRFRDPLYDPFCGSGTIAIEALMIAKNIAP